MVQMGFIICEIAYWIASVIFIHKKSRRGNFKARIGISSAVLLAFILSVSGLVTRENDVLDMVVQGMMAVIAVLYLHTSWDITFSIAIYDAIWARLFWWIYVEVMKISVEIFTYLYGTPNPWGLCIGISCFFAVGLFLLAVTVARWIPENRSKIGPRQLTSAILIATIFESLAFLPELRNASGGMDRWIILFLLQIVCIFIMYLQNELFRKSAIKQELALMNLLLKKEQEQYRLSKENIAIINQKCHDLKHQIRAIRKSQDADKNQYLKEVEDSIRIYESLVKTENEVLDTILTEKSLYCKEKGIVVSCVADGSLLSFMETMDLYSLFGNALDNAIEAVEKLQEEGMRQIDVLIYRQQNFLVINILNPVGEQLEFKEGLPVTTKADKNFHGFGMKSMRYIVKKYDGFLNASIEDGCFSLKILIPIPVNN